MRWPGPFHTGMAYSLFQSLPASRVMGGGHLPCSTSTDIYYHPQVHVLDITLQHRNTILLYTANIDYEFLAKFESPAILSSARALEVECTRAAFDSDDSFLAQLYLGLHRPEIEMGQGGGFGLG